MESNRGDISRAFVYADGEHLLLGIQTVWYKPSKEENIYGGISTKILYPVLRSLENKYPLSMWPNFICLPQEIMTTGSYDKLDSNMEPKEVAIDRLFVECNRQVRLMASSVLKIKTDEFSWDHLFTGGETDASNVYGPSYSLAKVSDPVLGRVTASLDYNKCYKLIAGASLEIDRNMPLRNGDVVTVIGMFDATPEDKVAPMAMVLFDKKTRFSWRDIIRRPLMKLTDKNMYNLRYNATETTCWLVPFNCLRIVSAPEDPPPEA